VHKDDSSLDALGSSSLARANATSFQCALTRFARSIDRSIDDVVVVTTLDDDDATECDRSANDAVDGVALWLGDDDERRVVT